jgi:hypothetical protein
MSTGVTGRVLSLAAGVVLASSLAATSHAGDRFTVSVGGGLALGANDWSSKASWASWAETATVDSRYEASSGAAFQGALGYRFSKHLGVVLAGGRSSRDVKASFQAKIPHPLFLERPRTVSGELSGLSYTELAFHLDLEWRLVKGPFEIAAFAGPTLARVDTDVVQSVKVAESYPYDEATYESSETASVRSDSAFGWNVGASAAWLAISHLDLGVEARYVRASVDLVPTTAEAFSLNAGGLQLAARVRVRF